MARVVIYQVLPRLLGNTTPTRHTNGTLAENGVGKFRSFTTSVLQRIRHLGATHVWYTGIVRHATTTDYSRWHIPRQTPCVVKGLAGSPYAITDYYDVDPDLAVDVAHRWREWEQLVARTHAAGLKVIIDFVPNHVAREYLSVAAPRGVADIGQDDDPSQHFSARNDFYYCVGTPFVSPVAGTYHELPARATGNDCFVAQPTRNDWYETVKLNYGIDYNDLSGTPSFHFSPRPPLWDKMVKILLHWAATGVDGFRCDMAEMVPRAFWAYAIAEVKKAFPEVIFIGEVYDRAQYRPYLSAGFDYLYDKVGMYDTLRAIVTAGCPTSAITARWQETDDIRSHLLYFLENHDEQRLASAFFAGDAYKALPAVVTAALLYSNPFMIYAGQEYGERGMDAEGFSGCDGRTTIFDYWCVESLRRGFFARRQLSDTEKALEQRYRTLLHIAQREEVAQGQSFDLMYVNAALHDGQYAFLRGQTMLVVVNFSSRAVRVPVVIPSHAFDYLQLREQQVTAVDLLTHTHHKLLLRRDGAVDIALKPYESVVLSW